MPDSARTWWYACEGTDGRQAAHVFRGARSHSEARRAILCALDGLGLSSEGLRVWPFRPGEDTPLSTTEEQDLVADYGSGRGR